MKRRHLTLLTKEAPLDRDQIRDAVRASLLLADKPADRHNSYFRRTSAERKAQAELRPRSGQVEHVVPIRPRDPEGPAAA